MSGNNSSSALPLPRTARSQASGIARRQRTQTGRTARSDIASFYSYETRDSPAKSQASGMPARRGLAQAEQKTQSERQRHKTKVTQAKEMLRCEEEQPQGFTGAHSGVHDILKARGATQVRNVAANALERHRQNKEKYAYLHQGQAVSARKMPTHLAHLVDFDGDGNIDPEERALMAEVADAVVEDIDGDGVIDDDEVMVAKIELGKTILARRFVANQKGKMWKYGDEFRDGKTGASKPNAECADMIHKHKYFGTMMAHLKKHERIYRLSSSDGMRRSLESPMTGRPFKLTARPSVISHFL